MIDTPNNSIYTNDYALKYEGIALNSARNILPILFDIFQPKSAIDLGCGTGGWLKNCEEYGISKLTGVEGHWLSEEQLSSKNIKLIQTDLENSIPDSGNFDLAMSTEVAEHLTPDASIRLIDALCNTSDVIIFSAAIPKQGLENHINEQWQAFWQTIFLDKGFLCFDIFRSRIWNNPEVAWWYKQNLFLFVRKTTDPNLIQQLTELEDTSRLVNVIHPDLYNILHGMMEKPSLHFCLRMFRNYLRGWLRGK